MKCEQKAEAVRLYPFLEKISTRNFKGEKQKGPTMKKKNFPSAQIPPEAMGKL
jgi:hypothetical protein